MLNLIILEVSSGFANRFFPILSCYHFCKKKGISLAIIWKDNTCRKCLDIIKSENMNLGVYFDKIPKNITIHQNIQDVKSKYNIKNKIHSINLGGKNKIPNDIIEYPIVHLYKVCHIISLFKEYNTDLFYPYPTNNFGIIGNKYLDLLKKDSSDFTFNKKILNIIEEFKNIDQNCVGIHLRVTDGGFSKRFSENKSKILLITENIINKYKTNSIFFTTDSKELHYYFTEKFQNLIVYNNEQKFINNDTGTWFSLVDLLLLSKCGIIIMTPSSSFSLLAYVLNDAKRLEFIYDLSKL